MLSHNLKRLRRERKLSLEDVATALGTSRQTVCRYENGVISNIPQDKIVVMAKLLNVSPAELMGWEDSAAQNRARDADISAKQLPILGQISCGQPIYASQENESYICVGKDVDADFCLMAHGDSMTGARIFDGDIVFIRSQSSVDNGEIAAVIINDEATLKRVYYYPENEKLILSPENPKYAPIVYIGSELEGIKIIGKAVAFQSSVI